jgi:hypothetical protein
MGAWRADPVTARRGWDDGGRNVCDLGISPDTPNCEYGTVAPGTSLTTRFVVRVTATHGSLRPAGGVVSESAFEDDNPFNQFRSASVRVS